MGWVFWIYIISLSVKFIQCLYAIIQSTKELIYHKRVVAGKSSLNDFITREMKDTLQSYSPIWWANAHIQILLTILVRQRDLTYKRDTVALADGGQVALDWAVPSSDDTLNSNSPIVVILCGITGCSDSMRTLCYDAMKAGYRPVVFNKRGHGGLKLLTPTLQSFGCVKDLIYAIDYINTIYPNAKLYGIGHSAGSGLLYSYFGETGYDSKLEAGVFVSPGYNALDLFCNGCINPLYNFLMTFKLKKLVFSHMNVLRNVLDYSTILKVNSIAEFDRLVYMKLHGYADLESYWTDNNPMRRYDNIQRPILCINALDDPICKKKMINYSLFEDSQSCMLIETGSGSHCGFFQSDFTSWANDASLSYLDAIREYNNTHTML